MVRLLTPKFWKSWKGERGKQFLNNLIFKIINSLLMVHDQKQDASLDFWRIVVPDDEGIKGRIVENCIAFPTAPILGFSGPLVGQKVVLLEGDPGRCTTVCGELSGVSDGEI